MYTFYTSKSNHLVLPASFFPSRFAWVCLFQSCRITKKMQLAHCSQATFYLSALVPLSLAQALSADPSLRQKARNL